MRDILDRLKQLEESQIEPSGPQVGDEFGLSFSDDLEISTTITDVLEDGIVVDIDDTAMAHIQENGAFLYDGEIVEEDKGPCWKNYKQIGMKKKNGKEVPNCVPESIEEAGIDIDRVADRNKPWLKVALLIDDEVKQISLKSDEGIELSNDLNALSTAIQEAGPDGTPKVNDPMIIKAIKASSASI